MVDKDRSAWLIKPGTGGKKETELTRLVEELIQEYEETTEHERTILINDDNEIIYFTHFPEPDSPMTSADVAMLKDGKFLFLPSEMAFDLAQAYIAYLKFSADAIDYLDLLDDVEE